MKKLDTQSQTHNVKTPWSQKKKLIIFSLVLIVILVLGGLWKAESFTKTITTKGSFLGSVGKSLTQRTQTLKGEKEGRINIALLGMRGKGVVGGGELADTIMVLSIIKKPDDTYHMSLISVPRDLAVIGPNGEESKINKVYFNGEQQKPGDGLEYMKETLHNVLGQDIHYAIAVNFQAFADLVDALGGVEVTRDTPFIEPVQFHEIKVCDGDNGGVFTVPTGEYEIKYKKDGRIKSKYPYCRNAHEECGGIFKVPAGTTNLSGEQALCYVRARATSSDFDRARRQQEVLGALRVKARTLGVLESLGKINEILKSLGDNVQMDIEPWEMQRFYDLYKKIGTTEVEVHKVLENSEEGLLYTPEENPALGYHLRPRGNTYDRIHDLFETIIP